MKIRPFQRQGYSVVIDTAIFDYIMPFVSASEWKILCFILRKTWGFQKETDLLSYSQIKKGTGLRSDSTVSKALQNLRGKGIIIVVSDSSKWETSRMGINRHYEIDEKPTPKIEEATPKIEDTKFVKVNNKVNKVNKVNKNGGLFLNYLPDHLLNSEEFVEQWRLWFDYRKERKKPITKTTAKLHANKLGKYNAAVAKEMLAQSINNTWQGIFPLNERHPLMRGENSPLSDAGMAETETLKSA